MNPEVVTEEPAEPVVEDPVATEEVIMKPEEEITEPPSEEGV